MKKEIDSILSNNNTTNLCKPTPNTLRGIISLSPHDFLTRLRH